MKKKFALLTILLLTTSLIVRPLPPMSGQEPLEKNEANVKLEKTQDPTREKGRVKDLRSSVSNKDIVQDVLDARIDAFNQEGCFPSVFQATLRATYYGLQSLDYVGHLEAINETEVLAFLLEHYKDGSFIDDESLRYQDMTPTGYEFWVWTSPAETTAYGVLSLSILGELPQINHQDVIDFLWSCHNL